MHGGRQFQQPLRKMGLPRNEQQRRRSGRLGDRKQPVPHQCSRRPVHLLLERWHTTSTLDLAFETTDLSTKTLRTVKKQLGDSDHRPVNLQVDLKFVPEPKMWLPRWNYKKANWDKFKYDIEQELIKVTNNCHE